MRIVTEQQWEEWRGSMTARLDALEASVKSLTRTIQNHEESDDNRFDTLFKNQREDLRQTTEDNKQISDRLNKLQSKQAKIGGIVLGVLVVLESIKWGWQAYMWYSTNSG